VPVHQLASQVLRVGYLTVTSDGCLRTTTVTFDANVFPLETVKKAAYKYTDRFTVDFRLDETIVTCLLSFPAGKPQADVDLCVRDLKNEVLDQDLRERIKAETAPIRNLILAHAFSRTGLIVDGEISGD
jgi:His-Xaa-Ser system protein HxsD